MRGAFESAPHPRSVDARQRLLSARPGGAVCPSGDAQDGTRARCTCTAARNARRNGSGRYGVVLARYLETCSGQVPAVGPSHNGRFAMDYSCGPAAGLRAARRRAFVAL